MLKEANIFGRKPRNISQDRQCLGSTGCSLRADRPFAPNVIIIIVVVFFNVIFRSEWKRTSFWLCCSGRDQNGWMFFISIGSNVLKGEGVSLTFAGLTGLHINLLTWRVFFHFFIHSSCGSIAHYCVAWDAFQVFIPDIRGLFIVLVVLVAFVYIFRGSDVTIILLLLAPIGQAVVASLRFGPSLRWVNFHFTIFSHTATLASIVVLLVGILANMAISSFFSLTL
mmetsp:Transcript_42983/g.104062  ORF Transcript_42983/g.104062 Transcript_42983/m.104062 type:complete len:225 (-) Transcript_42983:272-946(-)